MKRLRSILNESKFSVPAGRQRPRARIRSPRTQAMIAITALLIAALSTPVYCEDKKEGGLEPGSTGVSPAPTPSPGEPVPLPAPDPVNPKLESELQKTIGIPGIMTAPADPKLGSADLKPGTKPAALEGEIELPASLPPVNPKWKPGARFDFKMLPHGGADTLSWWKVPDWLQGSWRTEGKIKRLHLTDKKTTDKQGFGAVEIRYPDTEVIGYQQDREGYVWTCVPSPYVGRTVQNGRANLSIIHSAMPVVLTDTEVVLRFLASTLIVDLASGRIVSVSQRESLQTYRPIEHGKVLVQADMKFFDENGIARYESKVLSQARRRGHFHETPYLPISGPVPTLIDLRGSFDKFLRTNHWEQLIPERYPLPKVNGYKMISL